MRGKLRQIKGRFVTFELDETLDIASLERINGTIVADIEFVDINMITHDQRKHWWALMGDYEYYTGTPREAASSYFKYRFMLNHDLDEFPSLAINAMTKARASLLLEDTITWFIQNGVPFRKQQWYLTMDSSKMLYALTMKRICWVCGKHASIHHVEAIGRGYNRNTYQHHEKHTYMALCEQCHREAHTIGQKQFENKYHIKGIKLNKENLKELNVI